MTESRIQPKRFPREFYMLDIIVLQIDSSIALVLLSLITTFTLEFTQKLLHIVLSSFSIYVNSNTNFFTNLSLFNLDNKSISLFLIAETVSLSCS